MKKKISSVLKSLQKVPERKHYIEFISAALSVPVLITVILVNLNNLKSAPKTAQPTPVPSSAPVTKEIIIQGNPPAVINGTQASPSASDSVTPTSAACKKAVGPISIDYPQEGATITDNPVNFIIKYADDSYCSVVWSYRINSGTWSEYSSNSPSIFNIPNGSVKFELRVQSTASNDQGQLTRTFNYQGNSVTPTVSPTQTGPTPTVTQ